MTSSPDNTVENSLKRLLADVDDHMEFVGTVWQTKANASKQISRAIQGAKQSLDSHYLSIFLDLVGEDENMLEELDNLGVAHKLDKPAYTTFMLARNALRQELRTALQDRLGGKNG